ncbi:hypothetical protein BU24DRAFT_477393 [Aaosphaeria arxii CBS 175.79]|uniref:Uncharacterized protein n=1 Tax=Aaosphaeria arxii CBS 175.79 TaxID=1450172 RepID=A0A6A5Y4U6_9PLEO|nr:uncharacterized protein BU24DRAFT_477393 [Aaosphaeria arxii CBS 175.79]KAF2020233.1 hypothetical protein BU24DRAFT_477393 [Aaosphaeria arxii CBS 175.79]
MIVNWAEGLKEIDQVDWDAWMVFPECPAESVFEAELEVGSSKSAAERASALKPTDGTVENPIPIGPLSERNVAPEKNISAGLPLPSNQPHSEAVPVEQTIAAPVSPPASTPPPSQFASEAYLDKFDLPAGAAEARRINDHESIARSFCAQQLDNNIQDQNALRERIYCIQQQVNNVRMQHGKDSPTTARWEEKARRSFAQLTPENNPLSPDECLSVLSFDTDPQWPAFMSGDENEAQNGKDNNGFACGNTPPTPPFSTWFTTPTPLTYPQGSTQTQDSEVQSAFNERARQSGNGQNRNTHETTPPFSTTLTASNSLLNPENSTQAKVSKTQSSLNARTQQRLTAANPPISSPSIPPYPRLENVNPPFVYVDPRLSQIDPDEPEASAPRKTVSFADEPVASPPRPKQQQRRTNNRNRKKAAEPQNVPQGGPPQESSQEPPQKPPQGPPQELPQLPAQEPSQRPAPTRNNPPPEFPAGPAARRAAATQQVENPLSSQQAQHSLSAQQVARQVHQAQNALGIQRSPSAQSGNQAQHLPSAQNGHQVQHALSAQNGPQMQQSLSYQNGYRSMLPPPVPSSHSPSQANPQPSFPPCPSNNDQWPIQQSHYSYIPSGFQQQPGNPEQRAQAAIDSLRHMNGYGGGPTRSPHFANVAHRSYPAVPAQQPMPYQHMRPIGSAAADPRFAGSYNANKLHVGHPARMMPELPPGPVDALNVLAINRNLGVSFGQAGQPANTGLDAVRNLVQGLGQGEQVSMGVSPGQDVNRNLGQNPGDLKEPVEATSNWHHINRNPGQDLSAAKEPAKAASDVQNAASPRSQEKETTTANAEITESKQPVPDSNVSSVKLPVTEPAPLENNSAIRSVQDLEAQPTRVPSEQDGSDQDSRDAKAQASPASSETMRGEQDSNDVQARATPALSDKDNTKTVEQGGQEMTQNIPSELLLNTILQPNGITQNNPSSGSELTDLSDKDFSPVKAEFPVRQDNLQESRGEPLQTTEPALRVQKPRVSTGRASKTRDSTEEKLVQVTTPPPPMFPEVVTQANSQGTENLKRRRNARTNTAASASNRKSPDGDFQIGKVDDSSSDREKPARKRTKSTAGRLSGRRGGGTTSRLSGRKSSLGTTAASSANGDTTPRSTRGRRSGGMAQALSSSLKKKKPGRKRSSMDGATDNDTHNGNKNDGRKSSKEILDEVRYYSDSSISSCITVAKDYPEGFFISDREPQLPTPPPVKRSNKKYTQSSSKAKRNQDEQTASKGNKTAPKIAKRDLTPTDLQPRYGRRTTRSETKNPSDAGSVDSEDAKTAAGTSHAAPATSGTHRTSIFTHTERITKSQAKNTSCNADQDKKAEKAEAEVKFAVQEEASVATVATPINRRADRVSSLATAAVRRRTSSVVTAAASRTTTSPPTATANANTELDPRGRTRASVKANDKRSCLRSRK